MVLWCQRGSAPSSLLFKVAVSYLRSHPNDTQEWTEEHGGWGSCGIKERRKETDKKNFFSQHNLWPLLSFCSLLVLSNNPESEPRPAFSSASKPICRKKTMQRKMFFQAPKMASLSAHLPLPLRFFPPTGTSSFCPVMGVEEVGEPALLPASWLPTVGHSVRRY